VSRQGSEWRRNEADECQAAFNLKTAKALGITIPPGVLAIADEVFE
jgi:hypothetical protein